jgi:RNA polymerase sigma factor (sigma-70 family)
MSSAQVGAVLRHIRRLAADRKDHDLPDHQLLERFARHHDEAAFAALLRRHGAMVLGVCRSVMHDLHDAEDAFQAAFLLLAQKAGSIYRREAVSGWLYRVAYHAAVRARAAAARRRGLEKRAVTMPSTDPVLDLSLREVRGVLFEELERLPEAYRTPLVLCGLEEKSLDEAARLLGWTRWTVKGRLQRGRELLRRRLGRRGLELPAALTAAALALDAGSSSLSAALADSTLRAAVKVAAGEGVGAASASAEVVALVEGASTTLFHGKARLATVVVLAASVVAAACGLMRHPAEAGDPPAAQQGQGEQPRAATRPQTKATVEVRGLVLDPDGKPTSGAKLYLAKSLPDRSPASPQGQTGPDGRFRFDVARSDVERGDAEEATAQVIAVAGGFGCDWMPVGPGGEELTLHLVRDVPVSGRILDPDGKPVVGARVTVTGVYGYKDDDLGRFVAEARRGYGVPSAKRWEGPLPGQPPVLATDAGGRFRLTGVGRERVVHFHLTGPGIASTGLGPVMTRAADSFADPQGRRTYGASFEHLALASRPLRGAVRDKATGKPLSGVTVAHYHGQGPEAVTNEEGRYELLGLVKGQKYSLVVRPADGLYFQRHIRFNDTPGLDALNGDIEMVRALTARGRVTDRATGKPVAGARVDYHPLGGNSYVDKLLSSTWDPRSETTTDADGFYAITVMPGPGVIGVAGPKPVAYMPAAVPLQERKDFFKTRLVEDREEDGFTRYAGGGAYGGISLECYNAMVLLEPGEKEGELVRDVVLERPQERTGRVVDPDGRPLSGVTVVGLVSHFPRSSRTETLTGDEFTIRDINPKANRPLVFYHKDRNLGFYLKDLRRAAPGPLTVTLQPCGSVSGRVVDQDGQPVAGLRLHVPGRALRSLSGGQLVTTDKQGRFRAEGLVAGQPYWVWDGSGSFPRVFTETAVESGKNKDLGDLKMEERRD